MNQDIPNEDIRTEMQPFNLDMNRGPSFMESDLSAANPPNLFPQKSSTDFLFQSPKPYSMAMKDSNLNEGYNLGEFANSEEKVEIEI